MENHEQIRSAAEPIISELTQRTRYWFLISVPPRRINEIVKGKRRVTADTAMRLARFFSLTPQYWMGLQADYDLDFAQDELEEKIIQEVRPCASCIA